MNAGMLMLVGALAVGSPPAPGFAPVPLAGPGLPFPPGEVPVMAPVPYPPPEVGLLPAPVLAAKVLAPQGVRVTVYPATPAAKIFDTPAVFGFRPGYVYRFALSNLPYAPGKVLYPEVEVRGSLVPRPGMRFMQWTAPLTVTAADIERVLAGAVITKAIYLEDPRKAIPAEFGLNAPVEVNADTEAEAIREATANGRLVAILRIGNKVPTTDFLRLTTIDGTILSPGEARLRSPAVPPVIPFYACKLFDPIAGPKDPTEECFVDGGDKGDPLGIGPNGRLGGLDPTDVGVEFTMAGKRRVTTSNVVCLCVPRFVIRKAELVPIGLDVPIGPRASAGVVGTQRVRERLAAMALLEQERLVAVSGRTRPMAYVGRVGVGFFVGSSQPAVVGQIEGLKVVGVVVEPEVLTAYPSCPLTVTKSVDADGPVESGSEVTFTIRYRNTGNRAITDVAVSDSLSGRLAYVPESAQSDRAANFAVADNEVGSAVLRWELPGVLLPGQGGVVKFRARVR